MKKLFLLLFFQFLAFLSCTEKIDNLSIEAKITSFQFLSSLNPGLKQDISGTINETTKEIVVVFPVGSIETDISSLIASYISSSKSVVRVGTIVQVSGQTKNDFRSPINFDVTAENNNKIIYKVTATKVLSSEAMITSFQFLSSLNPGLKQDISGAINETTKEIVVVFPVGSIETDISSLIASYISSNKSVVTVGATVQVTGQTKNDFRSPINFEITAENSNKITYKVTATKLLNSEAKITSFQFLSSLNLGLKQDISGTINETTKEIVIVFPVGSIESKLSSLIASYISSSKSVVRVGTTVQVSGQTKNDFSSPINFEITAENSNKITYKVTTTKVLRSEAKIISYKFLKSNNSFLSRNIKGFIKINKNEIVFHNPHLNNSNLIADFEISNGATLKVNNVVQTSKSTSNKFSPNVVYTVIAENGHTENYKITMTREIVDLEDFLRVCPMDDPNINQILSKFEIRLNGNVVKDFKCVEPYYIMSKEQYTTEKANLQALRFLFYLDYDNKVTLPWSSLRLYDWLASKIDGINVVDGINGGYCCDKFDGKNFIAVGNNKTNKFGNLNSSDGLYYGHGSMNISLLLHEARHRDGFGHTSGCCPSNQCDPVLDLNNPSSFGIMVWWDKAIWEGKYKFGVDCLVKNNAQWRNNIKIKFDPSSNSFCSGIYTYEFPVNGFSNCEF